MKKLMIVAAAAAMAGVALADAQVYDMKLTVKTTKCKEAKVSKAIADLGWFNVKKGAEVAFRGTATRTIGGVIWGCDCDTLQNPSWRVENGGEGVGGYAFWDETSAPYTIFQIPFVTFKWAVLNRVGQMTNLEGTWVLGDTCAGESFYLMGAGFGTCTINASNTCKQYAKTMSGNFAGFFEYNFTKGDGCIFCGETYSSCLVAPFCVCLGSTPDTTAFTAGYGTWQLKYNATQSTKLMKKAFITEVRNCTAAKVANVGAALDAGYLATQTAFALVGSPTTAGAQGAQSDFKPDYKYDATVDTYYNVKAAELETKGQYYTHLKTTKAKYKNATLSTKVTYKQVDLADKKFAAAKAAVVLVKSLDHVETAANQGDSEDWGDDSGDDWGGDDDGGDDWEF